jgi:TatD DNase family protein
MVRGIDAHIHMDMYEAVEALRILSELTEEDQVVGMVAVSRHLNSCMATYKLRQAYPKLVYAAFGFHPEQDIPEPSELNNLIEWITKHNEHMIAIGEIGLPYYSRLEAQENGRHFEITPYVELLERFLVLSKQLDKPVVLHAVYEDAELVCDLLEKHQVRAAHFHWFKGSERTIQRMIKAGYYISITPDVLYEPEIQSLAQRYPLEYMMVETDGPWPFEGPFTNRLTHPNMIIDVIHRIAQLKQLPVEEVAEQLLLNTRQFYRLVVE